MLRIPNADEETQDKLVYLYSRCSICFDKKFEICLTRCRDQFCLSCFIKYINFVVSSSWGLSVVHIKCPVCQEKVPKQEWFRYVPDRIIESYNKFNQPFQKYKTNCFDCKSELIPCPFTQVIQPSETNLFYMILNNALKNCKESSKEQIALKRWITIYKRLEWNYHKLDILDLYHQIINDALSFSNRYQDDTAFQLSLLFTQFKLTPEVWKKIQLAHIKSFPSMQCNKCTGFVCLLCGNKAHANSCQSNMKALLDDKELTTINKKTIEWQLDYCRQCPVCSIMISREEGCNKVDCPFCGTAFCWQCQSSWSEGCAFYKCNTHNKVSDTMPNIEEKTENGVPNMNIIKERFNQF